jgi:hypothetical protein
MSVPFHPGFLNKPPGYQPQGNGGGGGCFEQLGCLVIGILILIVIFKSCG